MQNDQNCRCNASAAAAHREDNVGPCLYMLVISQRCILEMRSKLRASLAADAFGVVHLLVPSSVASVAACGSVVISCIA